MGTTTGGLPYPEPTDPIADGADAIRDLAEAVDLGFGSNRFVAGSTVDTTDSSGNLDVTFPVTFTGVPIVLYSIRVGTNNNVSHWLILPPTTTGFRVRLMIAGVSGSGDVATIQWLAIGRVAE